MSYLQNLSLFWVLIFGIIVVPGMDMLLVLTNSLSRGLRAGMAAVAGIMTAGAIHTLWGVLAVAALLQLPQRVVSVMLLAGALYLGWIGISLMRSHITIGRDDAQPAAKSVATAYWQGAGTALLNPKAYIFVGAVFPQFVTPAYGPIWAQGLVILPMIALTQLAVYGAIAVAAGRMRRVLITSPRATVLTGKIAGGVFLGIATLALWGALTR